ncbi:MAG: hypothetical protein WCG44_02490 [bacterium]
MKLIKTLITISLINSLVVVGAAKFMANNNLRVATPIVITPSPTPVITPVATQTPSSSNIPVPPNKATVAPTVVPTATPTPTPKPAGCIVKIDGINYEITSLLRTHSGGNVFTCGTDMSAIFWGQHNNKILRMMQQYKI